MEISKIKLLRFIQLVQLKGDIENLEALWKIDGSIVSKTISPNKVVAVSGELKGSYGKDELGIENLTLLKNFLSPFNETIKVDKKDNKINITSKSDPLKVSCILRKPEYITNVLTDDKLASVKDKAIGNEFELTKEQLVLLSNYYNSINSKDLYINGTGKTVTVSLKSEQNELEALFTLKQALKDDFSIKLDKLFIDILNIIGDNVTVSMKNNSPIYIKYSKDDFDFEYLVAAKKND
jgi:hypothetical protein